MDALRIANMTRSAAAPKVALITAANVQADGGLFDAATLVVEITRVELLAGHDSQPKE